MSTLELKELSHPSGEVIKIASGKTLDLKSQGTTTLPTGSVLQVVCAKYSTQVTSTSATLSDTGLTATITPTSTSSTILVSVHQNAPFISDDNNANDIGIRLYRGSSEISRLASELGYTNSSHYSTTATVSTSYLDSPSTTSATTYKTKFANPDGGAAGGYVRVQNSTNESTITLMEIKG